MLALTRCGSRTRFLNLQRFALVYTVSSLLLILVGQWSFLHFYCDRDWFDLCRVDTAPFVAVDTVLSGL